VNQVLLEILLVWIVGIPALAIVGASMLARRRERLMRYERVTRHPGFTGHGRSLTSVRPRLARSQARFPAA
jgi:hypothetical protein